MFKNSNNYLKLNYFPVKKNGLFSPVLTTINEGNFFIWYFDISDSSVLRTIPNVNFFSKATDKPLYTDGIPFLSVNKNILGTLGFYDKNVLILDEVIYIMLLCKYFDAVFWILSIVIYYYKINKYKYSNRNRGHWNRWINFHSWKNLNSLIFTYFRILITINPTNSKDSIKLIGPFIHIINKWQAYPIYIIINKIIPSYL